MAVSNGGDGENKIARGVITAAPGIAHFQGVWLIGEAWGRQAASPNVGLTLDSAGLTVSGPAPGQSSTIPWTWVQSFSAGAPMTFPDGSPATVVEVGLIGRSITLLVPPTQLRQDEISELNRYVPARLPPPPPPPPQRLEEIRQDPAYSAERSAGVSAESLSAEVDASSRPKDSKRRRGDEKSLRLAVLLAMLVLVALVGTVVIAVRIRNNANNSSNQALIVPQPTATTAPPAPSTFTGPPASANPEAIARKVNLNLKELPATWKQFTTAVPVSGVPSVFADAQSKADKALATCLNLPEGHVGIVTGKTEPGGPKVWPSAIFVTTNQFNPSAISVSTLVANVATEQSDLAALLRLGTAHCFDQYYQTSFASEHIISAPLVSQFRVPQHAGEEVIGLDVHVGISLNGRPAVYDYDLVVIGAGRLEVALGAQEDDEPFPGSVLDPVVQAMEAQAASVAGGH
jgi:hypothetical protein